jgi:uncharacterized membrane protein
MLIAVPVGLWTLALVCDIVSALGLAGELWSGAALVAVAVGLVGALLAAVPGLIDLVSLKDPRVKRIGLWHMAVNLTAVAVFALNLWVRYHRGLDRQPPLLLTVIGIALIGVSGWLGGEMVYVHGVAVQRAGPRD